MQVPAELIQSLTGIKGFNKESFEKAHASPKPLVSVRFNPSKFIADADSLLKQFSHLNIQSRIPWSTYGYYLSERPSFTLDPLLHAGVYYVQEPSSMFVEQALRQTVDLSKPLRILDLCAAPGGKSTLIQSLLSPGSLLVSNEVIRSRASILQENSIKWGALNTIVTNNDPLDFSSLGNYFDLILVDAPCSGSGLFRREPDALNEWSPENVHLCSQRQQRILADIWPALKQDGILIYATCSYSTDENETITDWLTDQFDAIGLSLQIEADWNIVETHSPQNSIPGYRFFPGLAEGEGFFISCIQKKNGGDAFVPRTKQRPAKLPAAETRMVHDWMRPGNYSFFKHNNDIYALIEEQAADWQLLKEKLYIKKAGVLLGRPGSNEFIPEHELALSVIISPDIPSAELDLTDAIRFLKKEELRLEPSKKGWTLIRYHGHNLGWIKALTNRVNNYYPKEWRIMKSR